MKGNFRGKKSELAVSVPKKAREITTSLASVETHTHQSRMTDASK